MNTKQAMKETTVDRQIVEMADAHCHLDIVKDAKDIADSVLFGVRTIITNGVDTKSNMRNLQIADNKNIFAMIGVDPEHANIDDKELEFNIDLAKKNANKIVGIGEIGLDYGTVKEHVNVERQKIVFEKFLDLSLQLNLPVSVHSRNALEDVIRILDEKNIRMVHIHFFEGGVQQAKDIERKGYMISVPPIQSSGRSKVIKEIAIDNIMVESDAPVVGASPRDVVKSIDIVAGTKRIDINRATELLTQNTKRFFKIKGKGMLMRF
jgi:TatD DNase family protein